jgi:hypothetical protein
LHSLDPGGASISMLLSRHVNTTLSFVNKPGFGTITPIMLRVEWAQLCELAFLDDCDRLCMIGIMARFRAPELPIAMRQVMIVVRIAGVQAEESFGIGVSMATPSGVSLTPKHEDVDIAMTADYVFITLRDIPLAEEGMHRFTVAVSKSDLVLIDVPVRLVANRGDAAHPSRNPSPALGQRSLMSGREVN